MIWRQFKYEVMIYFRSTAWIMPAVALVVFLAFEYSIKPTEILNNYVVTGLYTFPIMVWLGRSVVIHENTVMEQILYFRIGDFKKYYLGKIVFLVFLSFLVSVICSLYPAIDNLLQGGDMFTRAMEIKDVLFGFLLVFGNSLCATALGSLFHPRIFKDQKLAVTFATLTVVLSISSKAIADTFPFMKLILFLLPPILLPNMKYADSIYFKCFTSISIFGICVIYFILYSVLKYILCHKNKFENYR